MKIKNKGAKEDMDKDKFGIIKNQENEIYNAYDSSKEHLADELRRLDLILRLLINKEQDIEVPNQFAGMVITTQEICSLLEGESFKGYDDNTLMDELLKLNNRIAKRCESSFNEGVYLSLPYISKLFNLSSFEELCIIMCLAPELNKKYEKIYAYFQNDLTAISPTINFVLELFDGVGDEKISVMEVFDLNAPLMRFLMDTHNDVMDRHVPMISRKLKLDDWIVSFLLDFKVLDSRLIDVAQMVAGDLDYDTFLTELDENIVSYINYYWSDENCESKQIVYLYGSDVDVMKNSAINVSMRLGMPLITVDIEKLMEYTMNFDEVIWLLGRQSMIGKSALCLENFECLLSEDSRNQVRIKMLVQMINNHVPLTFIFGQTSWNPNIYSCKANFIEVEIPLPKDLESRDLWERFSGHYRLDSDIDLDDFKSKFRFTSGQIQCALKRGENLSVWDKKEKGIIGTNELYQACYAQSNRKLGSLAPKINVKYTFEMLVLPDEQLSQLKEITNQVKYRSVVYDKWGFDKRLSLGKGLNVLFSGPPGSGKTMAAEIIANELSLEIYKIDVSQVVSKYIGETEKNLGRIFKEAETSNAILFFDEADALFGKRSDVKDAHDRYANVETSYLLQKMEEYKGIVILATNLSQNIDEAFLRRLQFNVEFPFPEFEQRKKIWIGIFPEQAPLSEDIDYDFMGKKFILAGGNIKNIALNAAFYAAQQSSEIGMKQVMLAAKREYKKLGKTFLESDFDPYYQLIGVI